ncbi:hypothetical protein FF098_005210 [Parvularcula flava]|nr:peptidoglycan-binding protein [Aquisalinus luteolus]NHK27296.1 hypothetical protein [Aquisalinus luteolus]
MMKKFKYAIAPLAVAAMLAGCESTMEPAPSIAAPSVDSERMSELERQNSALRQQNASLQSSLETQTSMSSADSTGAYADLPPAKPGECYARILIPAQYESYTDRLLASEASERVEIIPAQYEWAEERVVVNEGGERIEVVPATYRMVTETVVVEPARIELKTIPARYETRTERVLVKESYTKWVQGQGIIGQSMHGGTVTDVRGTPTGEIMCLIEVPAEYNTIEKQVLVSPARTEQIQVPAVTRTVTKRVVDTPATTRVVPIPATYDTVRVRREVAPASERRIPIPETYKTVTKQRKVGEERLVWREVLCETNTTPDVIRRVQTSLRREGYDVTVDGVLGPSTMRAIEAYQRRENLGTGGLTMATVRSLGVM